MMTNRDFLYNSFFRPNPPSILRLACMELAREGIKFDALDRVKIWNLIWDRARKIVQKVSKDKELKDLHNLIIHK